MNYLIRCLKIRHRQNGLYLEETDHTVCLMRSSTVLCRWNATRVQIRDIHEEADKYLPKEVINAY